MRHKAHEYLGPAHAWPELQVPTCSRQKALTQVAVEDHASTQASHLRAVHAQAHAHSVHKLAELGV